MLFSAVILSLAALASADVLKLLQLGEQIGIPRVLRMLQEQQQKVAFDIKALDFYRSHMNNDLTTNTDKFISKGGRSLELPFIPYIYKNGMLYNHKDGVSYPYRNMDYYRNRYNYKDINQPLGDVEDSDKYLIPRYLDADFETPYVMPYSPTYLGRYMNQYEAHPDSTHYSRDLGLDCSKPATGNFLGNLWDIECIKRLSGRNLNQVGVVPVSRSLDWEEKPLQYGPEISFSKKMDSALPEILGLGISRNLYSDSLKKGSGIPRALNSEFIKLTIPINSEIEHLKPFISKNDDLSQQIVSRKVVLKDGPYSNRLGWDQDYVSPKTKNSYGGHWDSDYVKTRYGRNWPLEEFEIPYRRLDIGSWDKEPIVSNRVHQKFSTLSEDHIPSSYDNIFLGSEKHGKTNLDNSKSITSRGFKYIPLKSVIPTTSGLTETELDNHFYLN